MTEWHRVAPLAQFLEGEPRTLRAGEAEIALYLLGDEVHAIGDMCPHQRDVRLSEGFLEDGVIECPMHQSCFDIRTGKVLGPPAREDVPVYPVKIEDGVVFVEA
ncbi:non-heme iron oxygenase ferredoxin subunit [Pigmentiphaga soli]|uniref:Non-heme iron oxygenase ferredoxin subunit n=1 Tax=Pigmentiphaga soli TaxID=1007095 RepID=A0ABP8HKC6_9BURK